MSNVVTKDSMLSVLPGVLARDDGMLDLAQLIGWIFGESAEDVKAPAVFQNISDLDEDLLDILAKDLKIDWYDYDADIQIKRRQIETNWYVHKKLGTVGAVKRGLSAVWPSSTVQEWFDYNGDPCHFNVILSIEAGSEGAPTIDDVRNTIKQFKNLRSVLDNVIYSGGNCQISILSNVATAGVAIVEECVMY